MTAWHAASVQGGATGTVNDLHMGMLWASGQMYACQHASHTELTGASIPRAAAALLSCTVMHNAQQCSTMHHQHTGKALCDGKLHAG